MDESDPAGVDMVSVFYHGSVDAAVIHVTSPSGSGCEMWEVQMSWVAQSIGINASRRSQVVLAPEPWALGRNAVGILGFRGNLSCIEGESN
jgi:hypothetical protein